MACFRKPLVRKKKPEFQTTIDGFVKCVADTSSKRESGSNYDTCKLCCVLHFVTCLQRGRPRDKKS